MSYFSAKLKALFLKIKISYLSLKIVRSDKHGKYREKAQLLYDS